MIQLKYKAVVTILEHNVPAGEVILRPPPTPDSCRSNCVCDRERGREIEQRDTEVRMRQTLSVRYVCQSAGVFFFI